MATLETVYRDVTFDSDTELVEAARFDGLNLYYLEGLRMEAIRQKLSIKVDLKHPRPLEDFIQQEAYYHARLELLEELIRGLVSKEQQPPQQQPNF